jgi:hypothetical protein
LDGVHRFRDAGQQRLLPSYLFYRELDTLVLAYGVGETEEFAKKWPPEIVNDTQTIREFFGEDVPRYGDSFVYKAYKVSFREGVIQNSRHDFRESLGNRGA